MTNKYQSVFLLTGNFEFYIDGVPSHDGLQYFSNTGHGMLNVFSCEIVNQLESSNQFDKSIQSITY